MVLQVFADPVELKIRESRRTERAARGAQPVFLVKGFVV
jgi:hypothetical protein